MEQTPNLDKPWFYRHTDHVNVTYITIRYK